METSGVGAHDALTACATLIDAVCELLTNTDTSGIGAYDALNTDIELVWSFLTNDELLKLFAHDAVIDTAEVKAFATRKLEV